MEETLKEKQRRVFYYLQGMDATTPLNFGAYSELIVEQIKNLSDDELVLKVLDETDRHSSFYQDQVQQCWPGHARSSGDIWRHCIFFRPSITLLDILTIIYKNQEQIVGHFCDDVKKRVFKLKKNQPKWYLLSELKRDEYNLYFADWENINRIEGE